MGDPNASGIAQDEITRGGGSLGYVSTSRSLGTGRIKIGGRWP